MPSPTKVSLSATQAIEVSPPRAKFFPWIAEGRSPLSPKVDVRKRLAELAALFQFEFQPRVEASSLSFKVLGDDERLMHELGRAIQAFAKEYGITITFDVKKAANPNEKHSLLEMTINASVIGGLTGSKKFAACRQIAAMALEHGFSATAVVENRGSKVSVTGALPASAALDAFVRDFQESVFEVLQVQDKGSKKTH